MNIIDIINKKKNGKKLTKAEINYFIEEYTNDNIPDYQASALIMAMFINGMDDDETYNLTMAMANSGERLELNKIFENVVDKHSTGGIGDKVTIIICPILSAMGIPIAKMSGRGLGITGGTIDKLQSIPAYRTEISIDEFKNNVKEIGISLISQTSNLAPADKKIYALRDTIGAVDSIPLITSSILSKKIAAGCNKLILDVTYGSGAFMKNKSEAKKLAKNMKKIWEGTGRDIVCVISKMNQPLGYSIGNTLEIVETVEALHGRMMDDVRELVFVMCIEILKLFGRKEDETELKQQIWDTINSGKAFDKFIELAQRQGADVGYLYDLSRFEKAPIILPVISDEDGWVTETNAGIIGKLSLDLGAGRKNIEDDVDRRVGIILCKKNGDYVKSGECLAYIHANSEENLDEYVDRLKSAYKFSSEEGTKESVIEQIL